MIPMPLWIGSFFFLAAVTAFVCTAVKEDDDGQLARKAAGFFTMIVLGTGGFAAVILAIERLL
jgi:hypothetical protein